MDKWMHWDGGSGRAPLSEAELLALEDRYCSHGDTVHYTTPPKMFTDCQGSYMYDAAGAEYLDLQMWYSAVNFGYKNERIADAVRRQLETLPQVASQYLHREKIELAAMIAQDMEAKLGEKGRVHFNVGGSQAVEDSLKLVRNATGKTLMMAFEGGYHGRTLGASAITSSYRYRRRYEHFPTGPCSFRSPTISGDRRACPRRSSATTASPSSSASSRASITASGTRRRGSASTRLSISRRFRAPAGTWCPR